MRTALKSWFLNSGGGSTPFDSPAPLYVHSPSMTEVQAWLTGVSADTYSWFLYNAADDTIIDSDEDVTDKSIIFTGLSAGTTYIVKALAKKDGFVDSDLATRTITTKTYTPKAFYGSLGLGVNIDNSWATTTNYVIDTWLSVYGSGPVYTPNRAGNAVRVIDDYQEQNFYCGNTYGNLGSDLTLSGDFTIVMHFSGWGIGLEPILQKATSDDSHIWLNTTNTIIQMKISTQSKYLSFDVADLDDLDNTTEITIVIERTGTQARVGRLLYNGTISWGVYTTGVTTNDFVIDRFFGLYDGGNALSSKFYELLFQDGRNLSASEILEYLNLKRQQNFTASAPSTIVPKFTGTWRSLTNGIDLAYETSLADNGTRVRALSLGVGKYIYRISNQLYLTPTFSDAFLTLHDASTGLAATPKLLPRYRDSTDPHTHPSISEYDGRLLIIMHNDWYGAQPGVTFNTLKVRSSGRNYNITEFTELPLDNGISVHRDANGGYENFYPKGNDILYIRQEYVDGFGRYITASVSHDGGISFVKKRRIADGNTSATWLYPMVLWNGSLNQWYVFFRTLEPAGVNYPQAFLLKIDATANVVSNFWDTWSNNIDEDGIPSTATYISNAAVVDVSGGTIDDAAWGNVAITPSGMFYGIRGNGEHTGWVVTQSGASAFEHLTITFNGVSGVITAPDTGDFNRYEPVVWRDGGIYKVAALVDPNSDGLYRVALFHQTAIDTGAGTITMTFQNYLSTDNTKKHWHLQIQSNIEFNDYGMVFGTQLSGSVAYDWGAVIKTP